MKNLKINGLNAESLLSELTELFNFISLIYSIKKPDDEFYPYFSTYLKKYFGFMTFEQLETAFEQNSMGYLDVFLPKTGSNPDNKIRNFSIPSLAKVINAYMLYKKIGKEDDSTGDIWNPKMKRLESDGKRFTDEEKARSMNDWCDRMAQIFEKYRDEFEETIINIPLFTVKVLAKHKALNYEDIDFSEKRIAVKLGKRQEKGSNEKLIYKTFDRIIREQKHVEDYLVHQRISPGQAEEMPH